MPAEMKPPPVTQQPPPAPGGCEPPQSSSEPVFSQPGVQSPPDGHWVPSLMSCGPWMPPSQATSWPFSPR
jgi:hypothetical protein